MTMRSEITGRPQSPRRATRLIQCAFLLLALGFVSSCGNSSKDVINWSYPTSADGSDEFPGGARVGMSKQQIQKLMGKPYVTRTEIRDGVPVEIWVYRFEIGTEPIQYGRRFYGFKDNQLSEYTVFTNDIRRWDKENKAGTSSTGR